MAESQTRTNGPQEGGNQSGSQLARNQESGGVSRRRQDPFMGSFLSPAEFFSASPFQIMRRMSEEMDRVFGGQLSGQSGAGGGMWSPAIEVSQREGNMVVCAELPGLKPEEVKVELTDDAIVIQGERRSQNEESQGGVHRSERRYGQFYRAIPIPEGVNAEQVRAKFENGVLEVTAPMPQERSNRRQIPVQGASNQQTDAGQGSSAKPNQ